MLYHISYIYALKDNLCRMDLKYLGYTDNLEQYRKENNLDSFGVGRIVTEHKERYVVTNGHQEFDAEIIGNLRFTAQSRTDFPAVGDWVAISEYDTHKVLIHAILPRKSIIERQAVGKLGEKQVIATNVDIAFVIQSVDRDFNINRLERYLTLCFSAKIKPIILLTKIDLVDESYREELQTKIQTRETDVPVVAISNKSKEGYNNLYPLIESGKTYCLLGSSGVGKSTLANILSGEQQLKTDKISESTKKGRHITSHRELIIVKNGGILIDNPGMREVGITDSSEGLDLTFNKIAEASENCKFKDCTHTNESGCAVLYQVNNGEIDTDSYENYLKMEREKAHFELTRSEKRKKDKAFGKMLKNLKNDMRKISTKHNNSFKK